MKNSKYTKEFKDSTVQLVLNSEKSTYQIAKDLDINDRTLYSWIKAHNKANNSYLNGLSPVEFEEKIELLQSVTAA